MAIERILFFEQRDRHVLMYSFTSSNGFSQWINEPTHTQTNSFNNLLGLIFTNQPNLSVNTRVHACLHPNWHCQIEHFSFNLNICCPPARPSPHPVPNLNYINTKYGITKRLIQLKKRLWHRCFPVTFAKFLRIPFLQNTSVRLLLHFQPYVILHLSLEWQEESHGYI